MTISSTGPVDRELSQEVIAGLVTFASAASPPPMHTAPTSRVLAMMSALQYLTVTTTTDLYWSGRLTLCSSPSDLEQYDHAFVSYFGDAEMESPPSATGSAHTGLRLTTDPSGDGPTQDHRLDNAASLAQALSVRADRSEVLRHMDIGSAQLDDHDEVNALLAQLAFQTSARRTRRYRASKRGPIDVEHSARTLLQPLEQHHGLRFRNRRSTPRKLVVIVDVSGSMARYSGALLRFAHAAVHSSGRGVEVFTLGTRLTRISRSLLHRNVDAAVVSAGQSIPDWRGGTRLGDMLHDFVATWGRRGFARGAIVVICSDGWERGDPTMLGEQMRHLARLAHHIVWVNPHSGKEGFRPESGGMTAVLPHIDELVAGHTVSALAQLSEVLAHA